MEIITRKTMLRVALISIFFLASCGGGGGGGSSPTDPGLAASFSTGGSVGINNVTMEQISSSGDTVTMAIKFNSIDQQLKGADVDLTYDSAVTSVSSVSQGDLLTGSVAFIPTDDGSGSLLITNIDSSVSSSQSGTFCTITLKGKKIGSAAVNVLSVSSDIFNASGNPISGVTWSGGTVVVN